jgi:hypothetical protein
MVASLKSHGSVWGGAVEVRLSDLSDYEAQSSEMVL